ncbi:polysaccharide deacetylase family protein [Agrobacterium vitis]|uniref:polysaccharide deacetylase family protein n=1 Tax=Rhizobium/Agrobacterium group TaxID=227290 RepID=UPI0012E89661|nr:MULTISPECIES: polysaccharide deacetylase family protein [Rhizobium/Agrobacterium group]MCF1493876.1 polysaccharide deacetylase family protein [Allorhizobium ampelinum]MVA44217.1 polysaccharide deacetylase family protein [Agrobacterium vitis]
MDGTIFKQGLIAGGLVAAGMARRFGAWKDARGLGAIFTLHQVRPYLPLRPDPNRHLEITPKFLDTALRVLWRENYEFIRLEDVPARLATGPGQRPFAAFTLDDAYYSSRDFALPIFERFDAPFTVFVCQGLSERSHGLWWETLAALTRKAEQLKWDFDGRRRILSTDTPLRKAAAFRQIASQITAMNEADMIGRLNGMAAEVGIDSRDIVAKAILPSEALADFAAHPLVSLGAHTVSHRGLTGLDDETVRQELKLCADYLETLTGTRPVSFAYPYGDGRSVNQRTIDLVREAGFRLAVTTRPATLFANDGARLHALPRISLNGHFQTPATVRTLASGIPFRLMSRKPAA